jgi:hypothetical protein
MHSFRLFEVFSGLPRVVDYRNFGATKRKHVSLDAEHAQIRSSGRQQLGMTHPSSSSMSSNHEPLLKTAGGPAAIENSTAPPPCNACNRERACNLSSVLLQQSARLLTRL